MAVEVAGSCTVREMGPSLTLRWAVSAGGPVSSARLCIDSGCYIIAVNNDVSPSPTEYMEYRGN